MNWLEAICIAVIEGVTEFLPISSTAHMIFVSTFFGIQNDAFVKMYQMSIQFGAILSVLSLYHKEKIHFLELNFLYRLFYSIIPILLIGLLLNHKIEYICGKPIFVAIILVIGGIVLLYIDEIFQKGDINKVKDVSSKNMFIIGLWQSLAVIPGVSRSAVSIIGGMQQGLSRSFSINFSFFLSIPVMFLVTCYSIFFKNWNYQGEIKKGFEMILSSKENLINFFIGNIISFLVGIISIRFFIQLFKDFGFKFLGLYRIILGMLILFFLLKK